MKESMVELLEMIDPKLMVTIVAGILIAHVFAVMFWLIVKYFKYVSINIIKHVAGIDISGRRAYSASARAEIHNNYKGG